MDRLNDARSPHARNVYDGFTKKYNITQLVYHETTNDVFGAITREKQIKN